MRQLKITQLVTNLDSPSLSKYLYEISKIPRITAEEEVVLAKKIRDGDGEALERLVNSNLRFVISVAKQYQNKGLGLSDLISEGNLGLIKAAQRFDETRGFKFISYAVWWIRQSMMQALDEQSRIVRLPFNKIGNASKVHKAFVKLEQEFQREPTFEEIAEILEMEPKDVTEALKASNYNKSVSLDAPVNPDENVKRSDKIFAAESDNPDSDLFDKSLHQEIWRSLSCLPKREAKIITLYFGLNGGPGYSLEELGSQLNLTRERVRQIKEQALQKLKRPHLKNALYSA